MTGGDAAPKILTAEGKGSVAESAVGKFCVLATVFLEDALEDELLLLATHALLPLRGEPPKAAFSSPIGVKRGLSMWQPELCGASSSTLTYGCPRGAGDVMVNAGMPPVLAGALLTRAGGLVWIRSTPSGGHAAGSSCDKEGA